MDPQGGANPSLHPRIHKISLYTWLATAATPVSTPAMKVRGALWTAGAAAPTVPGAFTESSRYGDKLKAAASRPQSKALRAV